MCIAQLYKRLNDAPIMMASPTGTGAGTRARRDYSRAISATPRSPKPQLIPQPWACAAVHIQSLIALS